MSKLNPNAKPFVMPTATASPAAVSAASTSKLSADAQPFTAVEASRVEVVHHAVKKGRRRDEERCLFMTFSTGSPLTKKEISQHFTRELGECVEDVYVEEGTKRDPEFGIVKFTSNIFPGMIMANRKVVKIWVNNKPIWLKNYVPRSQRKLNRG